jgi:hypothetical protein
VSRGKTEEDHNEKRQDGYVGKLGKHMYGKHGVSWVGADMAAIGCAK